MQGPGPPSKTQFSETESQSYVTRNTGEEGASTAWETPRGLGVQASGQQIQAAGAVLTAQGIFAA